MEVSPYSFFDVSLTSAYFLKHPVLISLTREYKIVSRGCLVQTKYIQYSKYARDISSLLLLTELKQYKNLNSCLKKHTLIKNFQYYLKNFGSTLKRRDVILSNLYLKSYNLDSSNEFINI